MRHVIFTAFAILIVCGPAFAQDNSITVIGDDGKKVTIELEEPEIVLPGEEQFEMPAREAEEYVAPQAPVPEPPPVRPVAEPAVIEPKPYADPIVAPGGRVETKAAPAAIPKKAEPKKSSKKSKKEKAKHPAAPPVPIQKEAQQSLRPGEAIDERVATSIALENAPPSSGFTTARQQYEGKDVYVVTFKTDSGPYDVLVDAATGAVLVSAYVETQDAEPTQPGHLPQDWEPYNPQPVGKSRVTRGSLSDDD